MRAIIASLTLLLCVCVPAIGQTGDQCSAMMSEGMKQLKPLQEAAHACADAAFKRGDYGNYVKVDCSPVPWPKSCAAEREAVYCAEEALYERVRQCRQAASDLLFNSRVAQDCARFAEEPIDVQELLTTAHSAKVGFLVEGRDDLRKLREEIEADVAWNAGTTRQVTAYLALLTKTTLDLGIGLAGFNSVTKGVEGAVSTGAKIDWLKAYKAGKRSHNVLKEDAEDLVATIIFEFAADLHPLIRAVSVTNTFAKNVGSMMKVGEGTRELKDEARRQIAQLESQISSFDKIKEAIQREARPTLMSSRIPRFANHTKFRPNTEGSRLDRITGCTRALFL